MAPFLPARDIKPRVSGIVCFVLFSHPLEAGDDYRVRPLCGCVWRINGTITDNTGAVLPGVTVTATSPALIQPQVQVTGTDGSYRFLALPPGVYDLVYELSGFQGV